MQDYMRRQSAHSLFSLICFVYVHIELYPAVSRTDARRGALSNPPINRMDEHLLPLRCRSCVSTPETKKVKLSL
jgi:hypothetical protein